MEKVDRSNHKFIKIEAEVRTEIIINVAIRTGIGQIVVSDDNIDEIEVGQDMKNITGEETSEETRGDLRDRIVEENIETITEMTVMIEAKTGLWKGHFQEAVTTIEIGVQAIVGPGEDQEQIQIETE